MGKSPSSSGGASYYKTWQYSKDRSSAKAATDLKNEEIAALKRQIIEKDAMLARQFACIEELREKSTVKDEVICIDID
jgi:hypothetical protein